MFLSRITLDVTKRATLIALQNPAKFHGAVEQAFEPRSVRPLWRLDTLNGQYYLLLLSAERPCLAGLAAQFGTADTPETRDYTPLLGRIVPGSRWQFRLHANPTYSTYNKNGRGKVHACTMTCRPEGSWRGTSEPKTQIDWLIGQARKHGFAVEQNEFNITCIQWYAFSKGTGERVKLLGVTYEGMLTVTDAEKFQAALTRGLGRGKAYGMGLLTVMRV